MPKILKPKGSSYEIVSTLKESKGASVYKALRKNKHTGFSQEVILKIFPKNLVQCQEEFESLEQVRSPYCVNLLGVESFKNGTGLVLESIRGVSLFELLECFSLNEKEINQILQDTFRGLLDLKSCGICHGDLSLHNILLNETGQIKLIDFGKANYQNERQGTPPFIAPEVLQGARPHFQSDLFSLGVIEVFLKNSNNMYSLKRKDSGFFVSTEGLRALDPSIRKFSQNKSQTQTLNSLKEKVAHLLKKSEQKEWQTEKLCTSKSIYSLIKKPLFVFFFLLSSYVTVSSEKKAVGSGIVSIRTHHWFYIKTEHFEAYSPVEALLPEGRYEIIWKTAKKSGKKQIYISRGQTLILNDKDFLKK